jgi:hypothetical protein
MTGTQKFRTIDIGGSAFTREVITESVQGWTREQVHAALRQTAIEIVRWQSKQGNVASTVTVDNNSFKSVDQAEKKIVVTFGAHLARAVVAAIENALIATIEASTEKHTGALASLANWEWKLIQGGKNGTAKVVDPSSISSMAIDDRLILRPRLRYATAANANVAGGRRGISLATKSKSTSKRYRREAKRFTRMGFFGAAAELIRRDSSIRQSFTVYASFTRRFAIPGEVSTAGRGGPVQTGQIVLRPKRRGRLS